MESEIKRVDKKVDTVEKELAEKIDETLAIVEEVKKQEGPAGYTPQKGVDYEDGKDYVLTSDDKREIAKAVVVPIVEKVIEKIEVIKEQPIVTNTEVIKEVAVAESGEVIVGKINALPLEDDAKIDASHIKNLPKPAILGGSGGIKGVQLYINGAKKGLVSSINLISGTNINLTYSASSGRNDILIDGTGGGGGFTKLTATGTVNGTNTAFTFTQEPLYIISDGAWYQKNKGWTWSDPTATMSVPPNDDIYGFV